MPNLMFIKPDGSRQIVDAAIGVSVMHAATDAGIDEILAECGGNCMCATCHVVAAEADIGMLPPLSADEDGMLDGTAVDRASTSRLSCQILVTAAMDGVKFFLPERQV